MTPITDVVGHRGDEVVHFCAWREDCTKIKTRRQHTDHGPLLLAEGDGLADHCRIGVELPLPKWIAQHYDGAAALDCLFGRKLAPEHGMNAQGGKEVLKHPYAGYRLRLTVVHQLGLTDG